MHKKQVNNYKRNIENIEKQWNEKIRKEIMEKALEWKRRYEQMEEVFRVQKSRKEEKGARK